MEGFDAIEVNVIDVARCGLCLEPARLSLRKDVDGVNVGLVTFLLSGRGGRREAADVPRECRLPATESPLS